MKISLKNRLEGWIGHTIEVQVVAEQGETIVRVSTFYEDSPLANDELSPPQAQYERVFKQVGDYFIGTRHTVQVTAVNDRSSKQIATRMWTD